MLRTNAEHFNASGHTVGKGAKNASRKTQLNMRSHAECYSSAVVNDGRKTQLNMRSYAECYSNVMVNPTRMHSWKCGHTPNIPTAHG